MSAIKTCVLGVGLAGLTFHIPFVLALPKLFTLHAVLERNPASPGGKLQARYGAQAAKGVTIYHTLDEVLADPQIELIIVATPNDTHYEYTKRALEAGKHVLVDKPISPTSAEARALGVLAKSKNLVVYPYQNRRWDSDFLTLRRVLALPADHPKSIGTIHEFESRFDRYRSSLKSTWKDLPLPAAGLTFDLGAHLVDQVLVLFGRPLKVTAIIENLRGIGHEEVDDSFILIMHYPPRPAVSPSPPHPTSFKVILRGHTLSASAEQTRFNVRGTTGTFTKMGTDIQEDQMKVISSPDGIYSEEYGVEPENIWATIDNVTSDGSIVRSIWPTTDKGNYAGLFEDVAAVIRQGKTPAVKWEESAEAIEIIELAMTSSKEGRTIEVPPRA